MKNEQKYRGVFTQCYWLAAEEKGGGKDPQVYVNKTAAVFLRNHVSRHKGQKRGIWSPPAEIKVC